MYDNYTFKDATNPASTDAFADVAITTGGKSIVDRATFLMSPSSGPIALNWKNTGANSIDTRVLGSNDKDLVDGDWSVAVASAAIAAGASRHVEINPAFYQFYKFQHKATGAGSQGATQLRGVQKRI